MYPGDEFFGKENGLHTYKLYKPSSQELEKIVVLSGLKL
jgi:hypothetical protein